MMHILKFGWSNFLKLQVLFVGATIIIGSPVVMADQINIYKTLQTPFYDPNSGGNCASDSETPSINLKDPSAVLAGIPKSARQIFNSHYHSVKAMQSRYVQQGNKNDIPWEIYAMLHYREGGNNPDQTVLNGQPYGEVNVDGNGYIGDVDTDYSQSAKAIRFTSVVYNIRPVTQKRNYSLGDIAKIAITYNRGSYYKNAGLSPYRSPYVSNYIDAQHVRMTFPNITGESLAGKQDLNLGALTFFLLLLEKVGGTNPVAGLDTNVDSSSDCALGSGAAGKYVNLGELTYYSQGDPAWASKPYGDGDIAANGCGPTSLAMVIATLKSDRSITPAKIASVARSIPGYYVNGSGSSWIIFSKVPDDFNLKTTDLGNNQGVLNKIKSGLSQGGLVIASVGPGHFTLKGHIIVIRAITKDGKILVADPNDGQPGDPDYLKKSKTAWSPDIVLGEGNNFWLVTK